MRSFAAFTSVAAAGLLLAGCRDPKVSPVEPQLLVSGVDGGQLADVLIPERTFAELASEDPSFAGYYLEGDALVVLTSDARRTAAIKGLLEARRASLGEDGRMGSDLRRVVVRVVDYSFLALHAWRSRVGAQIWRSPDVVAVDLDEYNNRLTVELETGAGELDVRRAFEALGIPEAALRIERTARPLLHLQTLDSLSRPVVAGHRISIIAPCTLGFNARKGTTNVLVTASHCTWTTFGMDGNVAYQPQLAPPGGLIGTEWLDPAPFACGPFGPGACRFSDAVAFQYSLPLDSIATGRIARTLSRNWQSPGSDTIDASNPYFTVVGKNLNPAVGTLVNKMGIGSGWTYGLVSDTCKSVTFQHPITGQIYTVLCVSQANYYAETGDSGGPVFTWTPGTNVVSLAGTHVGGHLPSNLYFSSMGMIENDLGTLNVLPIPPLTATIPPPYNVPPGGFCQWNAGATGGSPPYAYQWRKNGVVVGTSAQYAYEVSSGNFLLELRVTDSSQTIDWDSRNIVVQNGSNGCPV